MPRTTPLRPRIRERLEDFEVEELTAAEPTGEGHHTWLWVEKRGRNTEGVARELAEIAGCRASEVGFAGRKDRRAVTRQWFSVPGLEVEQARGLELPGVEILRAEASRSKLRLGELAGNRFRILVRGVSEGSARQAETAAETILRHGLRNAFGDQRFGREGGNVDQGLEILNRKGLGYPAEGRRSGGKRRERFLVSAVQAEVFNRFLTRRPAAPYELMAGDLAVSHRTGMARWICAEEVDDLRPAVEAFELSPTGLLFGTKARRAQAAPGALERQILEELGLTGVEGRPVMRRLGLFGERRPLRVPADALTLEACDGKLLLRFTLPPGSYATVLLAALLPEGYDEGPIG